MESGLSLMLSESTKMNRLTTGIILCYTSLTRGRADRLNAYATSKEMAGESIQIFTGLQLGFT